MDFSAWQNKQLNIQCESLMKHRPSGISCRNVITTPSIDGHEGRIELIAELIVAHVKKPQRGTESFSAHYSMWSIDVSRTRKATMQRLSTLR